MIILGIETSCDETSAAIVKDNTPASLQIISQHTATSLSLHVPTGGIIPERAAREQLKYILPVISKTLEEAFPKWDKRAIPPIDAIAVTYGPGLIGSLLVGVETAKTLSLLWNKPLIPVNHLYGHIYANWLESKEKQMENGKWKMENIFPALALVVSGGHTDLVLMESHNKLTVIGGTRDDAAGEAFDKIGRLLGLPYPAGPEISRLAEKGDPKSYALPRPMIGSKDFDFSFSGLKTAVLNLVKRNNWSFSSSSEAQAESRSNNIAIEQFNNDSQLLNDLCASVQEAIVDVLVKKTVHAAKEHKVKSVLLGGGVAANTLLKEKMQNALPEDINFFVPKPSLCTDNGAMIAAAAYFNRNETPIDKVTADPELYF